MPKLIKVKSAVKKGKGKKVSLKSKEKKVSSRLPEGAFRDGASGRIFKSPAEFLSEYKKIESRGSKYALLLRFISAKVDSKAKSIEVKFKDLFTPNKVYKEEEIRESVRGSSYADPRFKGEVFRAEPRLAKLGYSIKEAEIKTVPRDGTRGGSLEGLVRLVLARS